MTQNVEVSLTLQEFLASVEAAKMRMGASIGLNHASTYQRSFIKRLNEEVVGACVEVAFAKYKEKFWMPGLNTFHLTGDYGKVETRGTSIPNGKLIIRDNDEDSRPFVLGICDGNTVILAGWLYGHEAKKDEFISNPNGYRQAWFVPQGRLRPIRTKAGNMRGIG